MSPDGGADSGLPETDRLLAPLNAEQRQAVVHEGSPLLILAGAGSGKTRVITTKIAWLILRKGLPPENILAVTFTNKAAREMAERASGLTPLAGRAMMKTFHSFGAWFLRRYAAEAGLPPDFSIYDDDDAASLLRQAEPGLSAGQIAPVMRKIDRVKNYGLDAERAAGEFGPDFAAIYRKYTRRLRDTGNADFGDLITLPLRVLRENPLIRAEMHRRFPVILVDEYQDSNVAQADLLQALAGSGTYLCVVGDDDQSIYRFRGAEVSNILSFAEVFPGTQIIRLEQNYRSTPEILRAASAVVAHNTGRLGKTLRPARAPGKKPVLAFLSDHKAEAEFCASLILRAREEGRPFRDWALLYRTNAQSLSFETEFLRQKIPYRVVGSLKFYEREEIKDSLALLALVLNGRDEVAFRRIAKRHMPGAGENSLNKIRDEFVRLHSAGSRDGGAEADLLDAAEHALPSLPTKKARESVLHIVTVLRDARAGLAAAAVSPGAENGADNADAPAAERLSAFVGGILQAGGIRGYYHDQDEDGSFSRGVNLDELENAAGLYPFSRQGLVEFLEHIRLDRESMDGRQEEAGADRVTLITLHNTKGLEFPRVILTGLENGLFPREDKTGEDLEEERRLMYVGCTRAMDRLYFTSCAYRMLHGQVFASQPSVFLYELPRQDLKILGSPPEYFRTPEAVPQLGPQAGGKKAALADKWKKGLMVFHDDYGYGMIIRAGFSGNGPEEPEYVITVRFESGGEKKFMPEYQAHSLLIVKDGH